MKGLRHSIELKPKPSNYEKPISMAFKIWMGVYALLILLGFSFASNWKAPASPEMRRDTGQIEQSVFPGPATPATAARRGNLPLRSIP